MTGKISLFSALAGAALLAACGGGGGSGSDGGNSTSTAAASAQTGTEANVATPVYAASSVQLAMFQTVNAARQQCGFPAVVENTTLDTAAQKHATYMADNAGAVTDTEVAGKQGFTGVTYANRAQAVGYPASVGVGGESAGYYTTATLADTVYGTSMATAWIYGVYHSYVAVQPYQEIGFGTDRLIYNGQTNPIYNGFPIVVAANSMAGNLPLSGNLPLTYPCQGTTNAPYAYGGEIPLPPGTTSGVNWGPTIAIAGNTSDTIRMTSGTLTDTSGNVITLQVLDSTTDSNKLIPNNAGSAYPLNPLQPNTTYTVSIKGTYNGAAFSRTFTFTTGSSAA
ncbi:CAP domain-containing protein [Paraburkholderia sp. J67]|uniref:CAP domain-containing protein n=1 Tax=Paraburkholderia sp. J67 TaxID=2805435 RepID=UPI002ABE4F0F|nr:CAP domain-containing protein [Paraburkholderia sp. J67]